jgi:hypothetical protein
MSDFDQEEALILDLVYAGALTPTIEDFHVERVEHDMRRVRLAQLLANRGRYLVRGMGSLLFHGTRYPKTIFREDRLRCPDCRDCSIHFTRALTTAVYFA